MITDTELVARATAAYYRAGREQHLDHPSAASGVIERNGLQYVELRNVNGPLAVYRVKPDGRLKRLRRWPADLTTEATR